MLLLIRQREPSAIALLYDTYGAAIYGLVFNMVGDKMSAERILTDTLIKVYYHIGDFRPEFSSFFTWVVKIARSMTKDHIFTEGKSIEDKDSKSVFDLIVKQGYAIDDVAELLSMSKIACAMELRKEIKIRTKEL